MIRTATAVVVRVETRTGSGERKVALYGPFLPHVGSATTTFCDRIEDEVKTSGRYKAWKVSVEDVFIGTEESDCRIEATR